MSVVAVVIHTLLYMSWMEAEKCWSIPLISDSLFYFYLYPLGVFVLHYHVIKKKYFKKNSGPNDERSTPSEKKNSRKPCATSGRKLGILTRAAREFEDSQVVQPLLLFKKLKSVSVI